MSSQLNNWAEAKNKDIFRCAVLQEFTFPAPILRKIPTGDWGGNGRQTHGQRQGRSQGHSCEDRGCLGRLEREQPIHTRTATAQPQLSTQGLLNCLLATPF